MGRSVLSTDDFVLCSLFSVWARSPESSAKVLSLIYHLFMACYDPASYLLSNLEVWGYRVQEGRMSVFYNDDTNSKVWKLD